MPKPNMSFYITLLLIAIGIIYLVISNRTLHNNGILLNAKTLEWGSGSKMSLTLKYEFYYKGEKIIRSNAFGPIRGNDDFVGRYFPVMYSPNLGGQSQLLITPDDFIRFNLPYPDSLKWVLVYLKN